MSRPKSLKLNRYAPKPRLPGVFICANIYYFPVINVCPPGP